MYTEPTSRFQVIKDALAWSLDEHDYGGSENPLAFVREAIRALEELNEELAACSRLGGKLSEDCIRMREEVMLFADSFPGYSHEWQSVQDLAKRVMCDHTR